MTLTFLIGSCGFELTVNRLDFASYSRVLFSFCIFAGKISEPWFKYRWTVCNGVLRFELGHGKLQSAWVAQGPIKRVA